VLLEARASLIADGGLLALRNPSTIAHRLLTLTGIEFILAEDAESHPQQAESLLRDRVRVAPNSHRPDAKRQPRRSQG
jgi:hypothetical protein